VWDGISASILSTSLLYAFVAGAGYWLLNKSKRAFILSLLSLALFTVLFAHESWKSFNQQKLIVYNVPQHQAIDFITGNNYKFIGDSALMEEGMLQNFHLKPSRISYKLYDKVETISSLYQNQNFFQFNNKRILVIDKPWDFTPTPEKINVDYIIISKNPRLYISELMKSFKCNQIILDGSNNLWKIEQWKKDCEKLHLPCYSVPEQGAFITDL
jgi:competence protein ComEC